MAQSGEMSLTARLAAAAIRHVEALECDQHAVIAARLYAYHRFPPTRAWRARLASRSAAAAYLGIARHPSLRREWVSTGASSGSWFAWRRFQAHTADDSRFKLYVSPHCADLPEVFAAAAHVFTESGSVGFKIGRDLDGFVRPDKMIGYFPDIATLTQAANALSTRVAGARVHGVPFTCQLDAAGLLSWGVDPPPSLCEDRMSWRQWITGRLARLMLDEGRKRASSDASAHALRRLAQAGIDVTSWALIDPLSTAVFS